MENETITESEPPFIVAEDPGGVWSSCSFSIMTSLRSTAESSHGTSVRAFDATYTHCYDVTKLDSVKRSNQFLFNCPR